MQLLDLDEYGEGIGNAGAVLRNNAVRAGLDAPVPTCPGWTVRDLLTHLGLVHRWAASVVDQGPRRPDAEVEADAATSDDLVGWSDEGLVEVLNALGSAPDDLAVRFHLRNAPAPRLAWTRRMCHETTIHAVDAMAAALGRAPRTGELWFGPRLAADGIDELLRGFLPRPATRLRYDRPITIAVRPDDSRSGWTVHAGTDVPEVVTGAVDDADLTVSGPARALYLALWNRGDEAVLRGDGTLWQRWRELTPVVRTTR